MTQNKVNEKQNEELMLKFQFAARLRYNKAEVQNLLIWGVCVLSALSTLIPQNLSWFFIVPLTFDIIAFFLNNSLNRNVTEAASLRGYFDSYVLNIALSDYTENTFRDLKSLANDTVNKHSSEFKIQAANTGKDTPPGIRDWYEISPSMSEQDAQYECQNQNRWWNTGLYHKRCLRFTCTIIILGIIIFITLYQGWLSQKLLVVFLGSAGILLRCAERIYANKKYYDISQKIDGAYAMLQNHKTAQQIKDLQDMINDRRAMPILESNHLHKKLAKQFSQKYHELIS